MQVQSAIAAFGARLVSGTNASPRQEGQDTATSTASPEASGTRRYDFSNILPGELREAVNRLIRSGDLDLHETSSLLGIMAPPEARLRVDGTPPKLKPSRSTRRRLMCSPNCAKALPGRAGGTTTPARRRWRRPWPHFSACRAWCPRSICEHNARAASPGRNGPDRVRLIHGVDGRRYYPWYAAAWRSKRHRRVADAQPRPSSRSRARGGGHADAAAVAAGQFGRRGLACAAR